MKASARNQFQGVIAGIRQGVVNDEVDIRLVSGEHLVAVVTRESSDTLGLQEGREVLALVKAPWVVLVTEAEGYRFSARNHLPGTVIHVEEGAVNAEVLLRLEGGAELAAIITKDSVSGLGLAPGVKASALFKASQVLLAVKA